MEDPIASVLSRIDELCQKELTAAVHVSKTNSLIQAFKQCQSNYNKTTSRCNFITWNKY